MNALIQTPSGWFTHDERVRTMLRAFAHGVVQRAAARLGLSPASMSATRSVQEAVSNHGSKPGESPAPPAAGVDERQSARDRRFRERRIRDDGSPYGVERRTGAEYRTGERRVVEDNAGRHLRTSGVRVPPRHEIDYAPHYSDLLARFHGRQSRQ